MPPFHKAFRHLAKPPTAFSRLKRLEPNIAEGHRIVVTCEAEMTARAILAWMLGTGHEFFDLRQIGVENQEAVQLDFDF